MIRILIAEDNAINRELLRELLEARGYVVEEASDGQTALRMMEHSTPDIVLVDIGMPVLDGYAVVRKVRENPRLVHVPVLAVTAYAMQGDREKILSAGFDGYLPKPVNGGLLIEEVKRLLARANRRTFPTTQTNESNDPEQARSAGAGSSGE